MATNLSDLSLEQLKRAVQIKEQILSLQTELSAVLGPFVPVQKSKPSGMSSVARAKLSVMAKARWAKIKAGNKRTLFAAPKSATKPARKPMSAALRSKIAARMKARWAKAKAAGKMNL